jgi:galacturan 1,4-alpha-galacturonidase
MDASRVLLTNFLYQGGDDCIAIKPRSHAITARNVTCISGNGIAIGSLGQYLEDSSVSNIDISNATIIAGGAQGNIGNAVYIKTWVGELVSGGDRDYESDYLPRGGGWGSVRNLQFSDFEVRGAKNGGVVTQDSGDNGTAAGTSNMRVSNVVFENFTGWLAEGTETVGIVSCSERQPCYNIAYVDYDLKVGGVNGTSSGKASCKWVEEGGVRGVDC